jgi:undecaprenyl-phosphate 4-deoxy-4-formamido-L-arabinose transferase
MALQASPEPKSRERREVAVSVVVPVFNEEASLRELHRRLRAVLDALGEPSEVVYVDDGSTDGSRDVLEELGRDDPSLTLVELAHNAGQHGAVLAGFQVSRGKIVVTIDADLQNPPEEIPKLLAKMTTDYGCMLRAYRREIVQRVLRWREHSLFIPALAERFTKRVTEVAVAHDERRFGSSRYGVFRLMRLGFDFLTGFSLLPVQLLTLFGIFTALAGLSFGVFLFVRRLLVGPEVEGVFTLFAILFLFIGALFVAIGVVGEYVARIYVEVRRRPLYVIESIRRRDE